MSQITNEDLFTKLLDAIKAEGKSTKEEIVAEIKIENKKLLDRLDEQSNKIKELQNKYNQLESRYLNLERNSRKNHCIIFGLVVPQNVDLIHFVVNKLNELLETNICTADINNLYQINKSTVPPIKLEFISYLKKNAVFKNIFKLKSTNIFIAHDLCPEDRKNNKILTDNLKAARAKNLLAKIRGNKLVVGEDVYSIEQLKEIKSTNQRENDSDYSKEKLVETNSAPPTTASKSNISNVFGNQSEYSYGSISPVDEQLTKKRKTSERIATLNAQSKVETSKVNKPVEAKTLFPEKTRHNSK